MVEEELHPMIILNHRYLGTWLRVCILEMYGHQHETQGMITASCMFLKEGRLADGCEDMRVLFLDPNLW